VRLRLPGRRTGAPGVRSPRPAVLRPDGRPGGPGRRTPPTRRASARLAPARAGALLVVLAAVRGLYGASSTDLFTARRTEVTGATWTSGDAITAALAVGEGQSLFRIRTRDLQAGFAGIRSVRSVEISVLLPETIRVAVHEREALLAWKVGQRTFVIDGSGLVFSELGDSPPPAAAALPVVDDRRSEATALNVGSTLDPVSLDAALRLGSLEPGDVGSSGAGLAIVYDDTDGFTITGRPAGWAAVFGFYTPTLRPTDLIPGQVRLLRSLLSGQEATVARVILAGDKSGTYIPRPTPAPTKSPKP
jgi:hypothetical protein